MRQLRARDIIRTNNNPIGDIAEAIVALHYGGERGSFSQAGWDVLLPDGERLQVKALRLAGARGRRNLSPIRDADYDAVIVVIFDDDFRVTRDSASSAPRWRSSFPTARTSTAGSSPSRGSCACNPTSRSWRCPTPRWTAERFDAYPPADPGSTVKGSTSHTVMRRLQAIHTRVGCPGVCLESAFGPRRAVAPG